MNNSIAFWGSKDTSINKEDSLEKIDSIPEDGGGSESKTRKSSSNLEIKSQTQRTKLWESPLYWI